MWGNLPITTVPWTDLKLNRSDDAHWGFLLRGCCPLLQPLAHALAPIAQQLKEAFIFGSVATSSDTSESDIDLAVVGNVDLFSLSPLLDNAERDVGRHIHVSLYSEVEWASTDDAVIRDIKAGPRIDLIEMING